MAKLAVSLYEPSADVFLLAGLVDGVREGAGRAGGASADFEEFAGDMGEVLCWNGAGEDGLEKGRGYGHFDEDDFDLCVCSLSVSLSSESSLSFAGIVDGTRGGGVVDKR